MLAGQAAARRPRPSGRMRGGIRNVYPARSLGNFLRSRDARDRAHLRYRYQDSKHEMVRERWAWQWGPRSNAIKWTPRIEKHATQALAWIAAQRRKEKRRDRADMK